MPISQNDLRDRAYQILSFQQFTLPVQQAGSHLRYVLAGNRVDHTDARAAGRLYNVSFAKSVVGRGFYLPYRQDHICSVELPEHPAPNEVRWFFTDNLSGCAIFIDQDAVTNNLVVYHANNVGNSPPAPAPGARPNPLAVLPANVTTLAAQRAAARAHYPNALVSRSTLFKANYMQCVEDEIVRKEQQQRTVTGYLAGTSVFGFYQGGGWTFFYQTWGFLDYTRPQGTAKGFFKGDDRAGTNADIKLFAPPARFYP